LYSPSYYSRKRSSIHCDAADNLLLYEKPPSRWLRVYATQAGRLELSVYEQAELYGYKLLLQVSKYCQNNLQ
jgi:hypothetical protein